MTLPIVSTSALLLPGQGNQSSVTAIFDAFLEIFAQYRIYCAVWPEITLHRWIATYILTGLNVALHSCRDGL